MPKKTPPRQGYGEIDESLRRAYEEVLNEGVPERFSTLLNKLRSGEIPEKTSSEEDDK